MKKTKEVKQAGLRALPVVLYEGRQYFIDLRLNEFRPVEGFESIAFNSKQGKVMCKDTGVFICISCGMSVVISRAYEDKPLHCMQCFGREFLPLYDG